MGEEQDKTREPVGKSDHQVNANDVESQANEAGSIEQMEQHNEIVTEGNDEVGDTSIADEQMNVDIPATEVPVHDGSAVDEETPGFDSSEVPQVSLTTEDHEDVPLLPNDVEAPEEVEQRLKLDAPEEKEQASQQPEQGHSQENETIEEQDDHHDQIAEQENEADINTSILQPPHSGNQFTTPLKSLPPLKDIDSITTPKAFNVAKDVDTDMTNVLSSPPVVNQTQRDPQSTIHISDSGETFDQNNDFKPVVSAFLGVGSQDLKSVDSDLISKLHIRSIEFQELKSENQLLKISQEQSIQKQNKKLRLLTLKLEKLDKQNTDLMQERDTLINERENNKKTINELREAKTSFQDKLAKIEDYSKKHDTSYSQQISDRDQEILKLNNSLNKLTKTNIEQNQKINQIMKEINDARNDKFNLKLENNKMSNEISYIKNQKIWYEEELKSVQQKYTELIKKHESEFLIRSNKLSSLTTKNDALERLNKSQKDLIDELQKDLEKEVSKSSSLDSKLQIEKIKLSKELKSREELLELTQVQSSQRNERVSQLESYIEEIKTKLGNSINVLETDLFNKNEKIIALQEKLRRTEAVLDKELHKETDLPKLSASAEMIASTKQDGISLSSLYSEYNHLKKQLVLERSQKERLANQLESFVAELESKKPTIANYCDQIKFYETSLQEMIGKVEIIRMEKLDGEKEYNKLKLRISEYNNDLVSMKKLCKDLGKQLCYYLIHSKIRDNNEDPLTISEKKAIENILEKSGNNDRMKETDTDQLISDRLVGFTNIIELQKQNEDLLRVVRQLGKKLESKDDEFNSSLESAAIDEAKEAILTLESELDSVNIKLEAVTKERDVLKSMNDSTSMNSSKGEFKYLSEANDDLKSKLNDSEKMLKELQSQSNSTAKDFNEKLRIITNTKNELSLEVSSLKHASRLAEARCSNALASLENARDEIKQYKSDIEFWKIQCSKQESLLIKKSNELKDVENILNKERIAVNNVKIEKEILILHQNSMKEDISQLKVDKSNLSEFVTNLQSLLKEREQSSKELSSRLTQSIENYQELQRRLTENEERILILSSQSELALKAQSSKLEQVNELSHLLLDYKNKLAQKNSIVESLTKKVQEFENAPSKPFSFEGVSKSTTGSNGSEEFSKNYEEELDRIRNNLRIAESQVTEFSELAKAAETALANSTNTFEDYKRESEDKLCSLLKEKEKLESELKILSTLFNQSKQAFIDAENKYTSEVEELKLKIEESKLKANAYDNLQKDYDKKIDAVTNDLKNQSKLSSETQEKYHNELKRNDILTSEVDRLKNECSRLELNIRELTSKLETTKALLDKKDDSLEEQTQRIQDELVAFRIKAKDLQDQNNVLLNQLELSKLSGSLELSESSSNDDLREVVSYLRREKDAAEAKLNSFSEDQHRLEQRLVQVSSELEVTKSELANVQSNVISTDETNKEHDRLLEQLQQLNILRESNTTLRNENNFNMKRISELENELKFVRSQLEPLEKKVEDLSIQNDVKEQTIRLMKEENEKNKSQHDSNDSRGVADSELEDIKAMKQRFTNLKNEFQNKLLMHRGKAKELEKTVESLKVELASASLQLKDAEANHEKELTKSNSADHENDSALRKKLSETLKELDNAREKLDSLKKESGEDIKRLGKEKESLEATIHALKSKADSSESVSSNEELFEKKLTDMKTQLENEKAEWKKSLENDFELKIKQELEKIQSNAGVGQLSDEKETQMRNDIETAFKEKYKALEKSVEDRKSALDDELKDLFEKELQRKVDEEVAKRMSSGEGDMNRVRSNLMSQHQEEIAKLRQEFNHQLIKEKDDIKNVTEKKFEIKLRMLNKKLDKLEGKNLPASANLPVASGEKQSNSTAIASLPATPSLTHDSSQTDVQAHQNQEPPKLHLGHQFTESTLTVHRPTIDRSNSPNKSLQNQKPNVEKVGQKRPMVTKHQGTNKKPKE